MDFGRSIARFLFLSIVFVSQLFFLRPAHAQSGDTLSDNKVHFEVMPYLVSLAGFAGT